RSLAGQARRRRDDRLQAAPHLARPLPPRRRHIRAEEPRLAPLPLALRPPAQARPLPGAVGAAHLVGRRGGAPALSAHALAAEGGGARALSPRRGDGAGSGVGRRRPVERSLRNAEIRRARWLTPRSLPSSSSPRRPTSSATGRAPRRSSARRRRAAPRSPRQPRTP